MLSGVSIPKTMTPLDRPLTTPAQFSLPFEILSRVVETYVSQLGSLPHDDQDTGSDRTLFYSSTTELLRLRLVSRTWSKAIVPFAFETVRLRTSRSVQSMLKHWSSSIYAPSAQCPVKRLIIERLAYLQPSDEKILEKGMKKQCPVFMDEAANLIELIGGNLKELRLEFIDSFGISPSLRKALTHLQHLKKLNLLEGRKPLEVEEGLFEPKSLADLLFVIPKLEYLTIQWLDLENLELTAPALSNLRYFNFLYEDDNLAAIAHICRTAKESLKIIECAGISAELEEVERIFGPIKNTLEGLFTFFITYDIPKCAINMKFPKLRVFRTQYCDSTYQDNLFLTWPMLLNIRTLVLHIEGGQYYLNYHFQHAGQHPFHTTPKLRHIIFILSERWNAETSVAPELIKTLDSHRIQCHVLPATKPEELMELDLKLNGPWE